MSEPATMRSDNLVWIDLEMTGLEPERDVILEIATIVTDSELEIVAEGPNLVISQPETILDTMDDWNVRHHTASGLLERVRASTLELEEAEALTLEFVREHVDPKTAPLCGNSIGQDRRFLYRYMPGLSAYLHYRSVDVSSIKELAARWYGPELRPPPKSSTHRALDDIRESIEELRFYRNTVFVPAYQTR